MHPSVYTQFNELEDTHWWFVARRRLIEDLVEGFEINKAGRALDVGCGTGGTFQLLSKLCNEVHGIDMSEPALSFARQKHPKANLVRGDINDLGGFFKPDSFDVVTVLNVLYHDWVKSEQHVAGQILSILKPGGYLVLTEPAFRMLMREHDAQVMGRTRYRRKDVLRLLKNEGFEVKRLTYFNAFSFLPAMILSLIYRLRASMGKLPPLDARVDEVEKPHALMNKMLLAVMGVERVLTKVFRNLPVGLTVLCVARKPSIQAFRSEIG